MRRFVLFLLCFPASVIGQVLDPLPQQTMAQSEATPPIPPAPAFGWVLDQSAPVIPPAFGAASLTGIGLGSLPSQAPDGAGNIDGPALLGQSEINPLVQSYALQDPVQGSLSAGTTVILLCGRQNYWLSAPGGGLLPVQAGGEWNVQKSGEWGLRLVSSIGDFGVANNGTWIYAKSPTPPENFVPFSGSSPYVMPL